MQRLAALLFYVALFASCGAGVFLHIDGPPAARMVSRLILIGPPICVTLGMLVWFLVTRWRNAVRNQLQGRTDDTPVPRDATPSRASGAQAR